MYESIVIIGVGSLGGFVADNISKMSDLQKLILIDPDIVESKNIGKSIYRKQDVGKFKVNALRQIIEFSNTDLIIENYPIEYIDNKIYTPDADLVIDCRDIICSRNNNIDMRLYISFNMLILDCEKNCTISTPSTGRYIQNLTSMEIAYASILATQIIYSEKIDELIKRQMIQQIPINYVNKEILKTIKEYNDKPDLILDYCNGDEKIKNFYECLPSIVKANETKDLMVIVGQDKEGQIIQKFKKFELSSYNIAVTKIGDLSRNLKLNYESYTLRLNQTDLDEVYIELLPETGGA